MWFMIRILKIINMINAEADIFELLFLGDGDTIPRTLLLNMLVLGNNLPMAV